MSKEDVQKLMDNIDYDKSSKINYNEFLAASIDVSKHLTKKKLDALFN
jgi:Ca2+-binding EF-hand superfamily protein